MPPCVVSEFCPRGSLYDVLSKAKAWPSKATELTWPRRINMALDAAQGMVGWGGVQEYGLKFRVQGSRSAAMPGRNLGAALQQA